MKKILILGSGLISKPFIRYLLQKSIYKITVASKNALEVKEFFKDFTKILFIKFDSNNLTELNKLININDVIISILPSEYHVSVAKLCLKNNKNFITASYMTKEMESLDVEVKAKGLIFINEIGLDPGLDHMISMKMINSVHDNEGEILQYYSYCGGLPAPEDNNNPLGYKFSWYPKGVILALKNDVRYLDNDSIIALKQNEILLKSFMEDIDGLGRFEVFPNRDSVIYKEIYNIKKAHTIIRGTIRYAGWSNIFYNILSLGLAEDSIIPYISRVSYKTLLGYLVKMKNNNIAQSAADYLNIDVNSDVIKCFDWLGLFSNDSIPDYETYIEVLCHRLQEKLFYAFGEKDMIILKIKSIIENKDRSKDLITSTLIEYGEPYGDTAMAKTVSYPLAIVTTLIAEKKISLKGVHVPSRKEIYEPVLNELGKFNFFIKEEKKRIASC